MKSRNPLLALCVVCLSLAAATTIGADVLVLKDGSRVATQGTFEVQGRRVLFIDAQGTLAALRLDDVDLEASQTASEADPAETAGASPAPAASGKKTPVLVLTDRDVAHVDATEIQGAAKLPTIVMYSTSWCGYCKKARSLLNRLDVAYEELDIEKSAAARLARNQLDPSCGVPLIDFGGEPVCGFDEARIRSLAAKIAEQRSDAAPAGAPP